MAAQWRRARTRRLRGLGAGLASLCAATWAGAAWPAEPVEQPSGGSAGTVSDATEVGAAHIIVFPEGEGAPQSVAGVEVDFAGRRALTNEYGSVYFSGVAVGSHLLRARLPSPPWEPGAGPITVAEVPVVVGQSTLLLLTVDGAGRTLGVDLQTPEGVGPILHRGDEPPAGASKKLAKPGFVAGVIASSEDQSPVVGARVYVRGVDVEGITDAEGRFRIQVPAGEHMISIIHSSFASSSSEGVSVQPAETTELSLELAPSVAELEDFVVVAPYIEGGVSAGIAEERQSAQVAEVIGSEQMSKSGDSNASAALRRVTGLTVVGGRFIYVRGMGERYSSTLLNGAQVPSPEPERRVVPLDLFPTSVLESVLVQKTYSADMPAEFGGGVVQLRTLSFPDEFLFKAGLRLGANSQTTLQKEIGYEGGGLDWLGRDDGGRSQPEAVVAAGEPLRLSSRFSEGGFERSELLGFAQTFENNWNLTQRTAPPDLRANLTLGNSVKVLGLPIGFVGSAQYSSGWDRRVGVERNLGLGGDGSVTGAVRNYRTRRLNNTVGTSLMGSIGIELGKGHTIRSNSLLLRNSDNGAIQFEGFNLDLDGDVRINNLLFVERQLFSQQVLGAHAFDSDGEFRLDWRVAISAANRDEPDRRGYQYDFGATGPYVLSQRQPTRRFFSELTDDTRELGADLRVPVGLLGEAGALKLGGMLLSRQREVGVAIYDFTWAPSDELENPGLVRQAPLESILTPERIRSGSVIAFLEATSLDDPYAATQELQAGYASAEFSLGSAFKGLAGARVESSVQQVQTANQRQEGTRAEISNVDILPAVSLSLALSEEMQLRLAYGRTVSRPDFREQSQARFFDVENNQEGIGNPDLRRALLTHYDARWEWYFSGDESVSVAGFFKQFDGPIETIVSPGSSQRVTWANAQAAVNLGVELDARTRLGALGLSDAYLGGNLTLIRSRVELDPETSGTNTSQVRALEGQSPYVVNLQLGWDDTDEDGNGINASFLYNLFGRRIAGVGVEGLPDAFEEPYHQLDVVFRQRFGGSWGWGLRAANLIDARRRVTQGGELVRAFRPGSDFSLSASYQY